MLNEKELKKIRTFFKSKELPLYIVLQDYLPRLTLSDTQWQRDSE
jgi:hypothetical protein